MGSNPTSSAGKFRFICQMVDIPKIKKNQNEGISEIQEIIWQIPEYEYLPKNSSWHWLSLMIVIILLAFAFWQKNFLFAVFIIISFLAVNYLANRFPTIWQIKINNKGISIGLPNKPESDKFYPLGDIESFDIHSDVGGDLYGELILKFKSKFLPYLKINIHAADEKKIEEFLIKFALRQEHHRSLVDSLSKLMGF